VDVGDPIVESRFNEKRSRKWLTLTIPVVEGAAYKLGEVKFEGNKVFTDQELRKLVFLKPGKKLDKVGLGHILKAIEAKYGEKGYIYATATPVFEKHEAQGIADVTLSVTEDQVYYLNRIEFVGNLDTRDHVLRREMQVHEQEVFDYVRYQRGLYRLKQTALFEIKEDPVVTKVPNTNTVDVTVKGEEASKNELLFGGGYGGVNGFYISGAFRTYNFLGLGTTLSLNADIGKVQKLYSINYSDPWLFGKRIGGAFQLYNSRLTYLQFDQEATGGSASVTFPLGLFSGWSVGYRREQSKVTNLDTSLIDPDYLSLYNNSTTSAVFTSLFFNTVNNPF
ncbi:MAG: POTRA domain-containing protein, partial [Bacillota bacterium]